MDQLETWLARGRVATAAQNLRETLARVLTDSKEFSDAMAEAQRLGLYDEPPVTAGVGAVQ